MNIIRAALAQKQNILPYIVESDNLPDMIDEVTYKQYESSNPLRINFLENQKIDPTLKKTLTITQNLGAEVLSAYTNPFYWMHKAVQIPANSQAVIEFYKKYRS